MKQTAVEWLYERLERMIPRTALYNMDKEQYFKQALEMEKEQMRSASCPYIGGWEDDEFEYWYNETFKK